VGSYEGYHECCSEWEQWLVLVKAIMNVVQGRDQWFVLVKAIMNVVQSGNQ
jgi:hypothetical protein